MLTKPLAGVMDNPLHPLSQGCVGHWLFNEGAGGLASDISGHSNHGTLTNMLPNVQGTMWQGSKFGGGLDFDNSDDYVDCDNDISLNLGGGLSFALAGWVSPRSVTGYHFIISKVTDSDDKEYSMGLLDDEIIFHYEYNKNDFEHVTTTANLAVNRWYHLLITFDSSTKRFKVYKNGLYLESIVAPAFTTKKTDSVHIGNFGGSYNTSIFDGTIDSVRIYNRTLNLAEVQQLYSSPFCTLMQVPVWQLYSPSVGGLSIPVAMYDYAKLRA